jgi:hypothetical protein
MKLRKENALLPSFGGAFGTPATVMSRPLSSRRFVTRWHPPESPHQSGRRAAHVIDAQIVEPHLHEPVASRWFVSPGRRPEVALAFMSSSCVGPSSASR